MQITIKELNGTVVDVFEDVETIKESIVPSHIVVVFNNKRNMLYPVKDFVIMFQEDGEG